MIIAVKEIHPPQAGKKMARVIADDGTRFDIWPDKLANVNAGQRYEVKIRERDFEGRKFFSIEKISLAPPPVDSGASRLHLNGAPAAPLLAGEAEYVGRVLAALISAGQVDRDSLADMTDWLRTVWRQTEVPYR